ncbi:oxygen-independent coproporphyrinogen III oxidase 2 [gut metagenome]|uniref:Oxygen-independent coproporphyrinogen III oxidase 2 n=1 Tax=gut metagenome TaxID=749906 RepID=J9GA30_9ZZZZ
MAAFFEYQLLHDVLQPTDGAEVALLSINHVQGRVEAVAEQGGAAFHFGVACQQGADAYGTSLASGEVKRCVKIAVYEAFCSLTGTRPELPWGILTGVRPGKLAHKLVDGGVAFEQLADTLASNYLLPHKQGRLLTDICRLQKQLVKDEERFNEAGVYIGIPFCPSRCTYCSFPAGIVPQDEESQQNFVNLIEQDIENVVQLVSMHSLRVTSLYIGGGTPTSLNDRVFAHVY